MYFRALGDGIQEGDVDVHGANTYLSILQFTLGIRLNRSPLLDDDSICGTVDFLRGHIDHAVAELWKDENFGKSFETVFLCRNLRCSRSASRPHYPAFIFPGNTPGMIGSSSVSPVYKNSRSALFPYLSQFGRYFRSEFLTPRLINAMLTDDTLSGPLATVYNCMRETWGAGEEDVRYWLWDMEASTPVLRVDRAEQLLVALDVYRPRPPSSLEDLTEVVRGDGAGHRTAMSSEPPRRRVANCFCCFARSLAVISLLVFIT